METVEVDLDPRSFSAWALEQGWSDGLPCIPPTPEIVEEYLAATTRSADEVLGTLPPSEADCTVRHVAVNAVLAGAPPSSLPLLLAAVEAVAAPLFNLTMQNATSASTAPALIVNGPVRVELDLPFAHGCLGGAASPATAIGRALRLVIRNVAGQQVGVNSESVFGQPARVAGLVVAEWEERSPWLPLSERRGVPGSALTAFASMGTMNVVDTVAEDAVALAEMLGKSMAYLGANHFLARTWERIPGEVALALNPVWAEEVFGRQVGSLEEVQQLIWDHAAIPLDWFPRDYQAAMDSTGRVGRDGRIPLVATPDKILIFVCGGTAALHATVLSGYAFSLASTEPIGE